MSLLDGLAELIAPTRCAGCEMPGEVFCAECVISVTRVASELACPRCGAPYGALICTECWDRRFAFGRALAVAEFESGLARAIVLHKDAGERRLGGVLGSMLADATSQAWPGWPQAVAWIPATRSARSRRGFDHAQGIAKPVAAAFGLTPSALLARSHAADQRLLDRSARLERAAVQPFLVVGDVPRRVLVVDDVMTTGATLDAAAAALTSAGVIDVRVAVVARVW